MMKLKLNLLVTCLIILSLLLSGCELYEGLYGGEEEEGPIYIPIEDILIIDEEVKGTVMLDSIEERITVNVKEMAKEEGYNYEVWLIDKDENVQLSIGKFDVDEDGDGELIVDVPNQDILSTDSVMITKEPVPDDSDMPNAVVLEESIVESADVMEIKLKAIKKEEEVEEVVIEEEIEEVPEEIVIVEEEEEVEEVVIEERADVLIVQEKDLVKLKLKAHDPDKDEITYVFSSPLDEDGAWQTGYGDAGEYTITVTVSDGTLSTSKDVLIIVNKKEEAPVIESVSPKSMTLTTNENSKVEFSAKASDLNNDKLDYSWKLDGNDASAEQKYTYKTTYDDAGAHTVKLIISDRTLTAEKIWSVTVENVNREPVLKRIDSIKVKETGTVSIKPEAEDPDGDALTYTISEPVGDDGVWETTYDDAGDYTITVSVSDGVDEYSQVVKITVENVNRAPVIEDIVLG